MISLFAQLALKLSLTVVVMVASYFMLDFLVSTKYQIFGKFVNQRLGFQFFSMLVLDSLSEEEESENTVVVNPEKGSIDLKSFEAVKGKDYNINFSETKVNLAPLVGYISLSAALVGVSYFASKYMGIDPAVLNEILTLGKLLREVAKTVAEIKIGMSVKDMQDLGIDANLSPLARIKEVRLVDASRLPEEKEEEKEEEDEGGLD